MTTEEIKNEILKTSHKTIGYAREKCINNFSENIEFVIRKFDASNLNYPEMLKLRKKIYEETPKLSIDEVVQELTEELNDLSWIDLILYKAEKNKSIFEVQLIKKPTGAEIVNISFHGGFPIPQYAANSVKKFDINWQQNSFGHKWKQFWWKVKTKQEIRLLENKNNVC